MITRNIFTSVFVLAILLIANAAIADGETWHFNVDASAGARYDSNVGLPDIDANSGEADSIMEVAGGVSLTFEPDGRPYVLRAGYDYSGTSHRRFGIFDLDLHHGFAEVQLRHAQFDAALTFDHYDGVLDGEDYVVIDQLSPSVARLFGTRVYIRAAWMATARDYKSLPERNARSSAARVDAYVLLDNLDRYVALGVQVNDESTTAQEFEYAGYQVGLTYAHTFELPSARLLLKGNLRFEERRYDYVAPVTGKRREDARWRAGLEAEIPFSEYVSLHATLEHTDNGSNVETQTLVKDVVGLEVRLAF